MRGRRFLWPVGCLENQLRAKHDNLPGFTYYVPERPHQEVLLWVARRGSLTWTVLIWAHFYIFLAFSFKYCISLYLDSTLRKFCKWHQTRHRYELSQNECLSLKIKSIVSRDHFKFLWNSTMQGRNWSTIYRFTTFKKTPAFWATETPGTLTTTYLET